MKDIIIAAICAAFMAGCIVAYCDQPQVFKSFSTGKITGWEDRDGFHACRPGGVCDIPESYDLVWVK